MPNKKDYNQIESLENWVAWTWLTGVRAWSLAKTAYELHLNERRLIEWVNARSATMNKLMKAHPKKVETILKDLKKRFPKEVKKESKLPNIQLKRVLGLLAEGLSIPEMAAELKVKPDDFRTWYNANLQLINSQIKMRPQLMDVDPFLRQ